jgi:hypothetical protein
VRLRGRGVNIRPYRLALLMLVTFAAGAVIGCWRIEVMKAELHTCAICGQPLSADLAHGHRDCYLPAPGETQTPVLAEMQTRWQEAVLSAEERSEASAGPADTRSGPEAEAEPASGG